MLNAFVLLHLQLLVLNVLELHIHVSLTEGICPRQEEMESSITNREPNCE